MYYEKIGGVRYRVTYGDNGEKIYDPPLPDRDRHESNWSENIASIVNSGRCPGSRTDTDFHARRGTLVQQLGGDEAWAKFITKRAKGYGYTPGVNDVYLSQLVRTEYGPGDPQAWIPASEGRALVAKRCRERGLGCEGAVSVKSRKPEEVPS